MTTFNDREKAMERQYVQKEELEFKVHARANKLLGLWAAEKLGKSGDSAEAYARDVVTADFQTAGDADVIGKVAADLAAASVAVSADVVRSQREQCLAEARRQIMPAE